MDIIYKTDDGRTFDNRYKAEDHANDLAKEDAKREANWKAAGASLYDSFNMVVRAFNAGNWNDVIAGSYLSDNMITYTTHKGRCLSHPEEGKIKLMAGIARAIRDNNYEAAFESAWCVKEGFGEDAKEADILCPIAIEEGKKAFQRVKGYEITDKELTQIRKSLPDCSPSSSSSYSTHSAASAPKKKSNLLRNIIIAVIVIIVLYNAVPLVSGIFGNRNSSASQTTAGTTETQRAQPTDFSDFVGTWKRDNFNNTLTFTENTLQSSSQGYSWSFVSASGNRYSIRGSAAGTNVSLNMSLVNGNIEISGDSGSSENNWNGTWKKQ